MAYLAGYPPMDFQGHAGFAATFYDAFPDLRHTIQEVVTDRERATVRLHITGTNTESFMGMPATGKSIDIGVLVLMRIGGGKVSEIYGEFDQLGLMQQIGAVPAQVG
jgi:predicted ester cyclase